MVAELKALAFSLASSEVTAFTLLAFVKHVDVLFKFTVFFDGLQQLKVGVSNVS